MGGRGSRRSLQLSDRVAGLARVQANLAKTQQPDQAQTPSQPRPKSRRLRLRQFHLKESWSECHAEETSIESTPVMGGEDFAFYTEHVPGCFVGLGIRNEAIGSTFNVHHPQFKVDEDVLPVGSALHTALAFQSLAELS